MDKIIKNFILPTVECPRCGRPAQPWRFEIRLSNGPFRRAYVHDTMVSCNFCGSNFAYGEEEEV